MRKLTLTTVTLAALALAGCSEYRHQATSTPTPMPFEVREPKPAVLIHSVTGRRTDGLSRGAQPYAGDLAKALSATGVFSAVLLPGETPTGPAPVRTLTVQVDTTDDFHGGRRFGNALLCVFTVYLAAPFVTENYDTITTSTAKLDGASLTCRTTGFAEWGLMSTIEDLRPKAAAMSETANAQALAKLVAEAACK